MRAVLFLCLGLTALAARGQSPEALLSMYHEVAVKSQTDFSGFSVERGREFYRTVRHGPNGEHACASCHGIDPTRAVEGHSGDIRAECPACHLSRPGATGRRPAIRREIRPLAPAADPVRFTDPDHTELWFDVNCFYVLGRGCTALEKGDVLAYLLSLK
ncbi:MAG: DUF1924 domain-containing protein [Burkholderiales bacterium]